MTSAFTPDSEAVSRMSEPMRHAARALLASYEQLVAFQLETARRYAELTFNEMRGLLDVRDGDSLKSFMSQQQSVMRELGDAWTSDARRLSEMGKAWTQEMEQVTRESSDAVTELARAAEQRKSA